MKTFIYSIIFIFKGFSIISQNILPNPSFEITDPSYCGGTGFSSGYYPICASWDNAGNFPGTGTSCDHNCNAGIAGILFDVLGSAHTGNYAVGVAIWDGLTEGVTATLNSPVSAGDVLNFSIWFKYCNSSFQGFPNSAAVPFGLFFHSSQATTSGDGYNLIETPHHVVNLSGINVSGWTNYSATITVPVNATKVTIGSFQLIPSSGSPTAYIAIDDVSLIPSNPCITSPATAGASSGGVITCSTPNITLTGTGGGTYSWSGPSILSGATTANPVINAGGAYNVLVTAANGCTATTNVVVSQNTTPPSPSASSGGIITCSSPNVTLTGGGGGSYSWTGPGIVSGATTANPAVNAGGTYNLTVTDGSNGCSAGTSVVVSQNTTPPSPSASSGGVITCSSPNVTLTGSGGGSYSWTGPGIVSGAATANPVVNAGGTYNLTVTGGNGCTAGTSVVVSQNTTPPSPSASSGGVITCSSPNVTLTGSGGGSYSWTGPGIVSGAATANPVVNAGGTYNLTVTGGNGCTAGASVNVTQSTTLPTASSTAGTTNLNCLTTSTSLNGGATGGSSPYSYSWSPATGLSATNISNPTANPSSSQTYVLTVTDDNGCQSTSNVTINVNTTPPSVTASAGSVKTCSNPNVTLNATGGGSYSWTGTGIVSGATTANPVVNQAGTFNVTVTGSNGCTANSSVNVTQNTTVPSIALSTASTLSTTCASPNVNLGATSNANPTTTYTWLTPLSTTLTGNPVNVSATGIYTVFVTNTSNGCNTTTIPTTVQVVADANIPVVTLSANSGTLTCSVTSIGVTANTTASPVTYNWLPTTGILSGANSATPVFNAAGNYSLTVTNTANSCASTGASNVVTIVANNTNPTAGASASSVVLNCTNTSLVLTGTGGGTYSWSGPGIVSGGNTANPTINQVGTYSLVVTNSGNNCVSNNAATVTITQNTTTPSLVLGTASTLSTTCANPTATLTASSSADPSTIYTWLTPISTTLTGSSVNASAAGIYTVFVIDSNNGCVSSFAATGTTVELVPDSNIPVITLSSNTAAITCSNPTPTISANANVSTATYNWSPTTGIVSGANTNNPTFNAPGSYSLVVTNTANSCVTGNSDYVVTVVSNTIAPVVSLSAGSNTGTITCSNPNVVVSPTINPSSGLTYTWSPTTGLSSNPNQANATFIANGVYQLSVTDVVTGCVSVLDAASSFTVVSNIDTPTISVVPTSSNTILGCGTNATVMYSVAVTSASGNNSYNWQPSGSNSVFTTVSGAGIHSVTVTDNINGCSTSTTFNVLSNTTSPSITAADSTLFPCDSNATALIATSSNPNVSYAWQGASVLSGANSNVASIGSVGVYTVIVTDNVTNCFSTHTVAVTMDSVVALFSANPNIGVEPLIVTFFNNSVSSNTANTTYSWDFGSASPTSTLTNPSNTFELSGVYSVTLVATLGVCSDSAYTTVIVNEDVTLIIPNFFTPNGDSQNELFFITGIEKYPNNQLEIYNRWGSLVYLKKAYNNTFEGKPNQPSMGNGMLPTGTYFYNLDLGDNTTKPFKGYIELKY